MNKSTNNKPRAMHDLVEEARQLRLQTEALEKKVRLARGTRNIVRVPPDAELSTPLLMDTVRALIEERPRSFQDLLELTGARDNRIKGVLMRIQRDGATLVNLGEPTRALWFLPKPEVLKRLNATRRHR